MASGTPGAISAPDPAADPPRDDLGRVKRYASKPKISRAERFAQQLAKPPRLQSGPRERLRGKLRSLATAKGLTTFTLPGMDVIQLSIRYLEGGRTAFLNLVQLAMLNKEPPAVNWWGVYADLTNSERMQVSLDDVCAAAGVRPADLLACVVGCAVEHAADVGNLMAAALHPKVVHQAAKSAMRIGGEFAAIAQRDRKMMLQHAGFIPVPKNAVVHVRVNANATAAAANGQPSVPSFLSDVASIQAPKQAIQKQLTDAVDLEPMPATPAAPLIERPPIPIEIDR